MEHNAVAANRVRAEIAEHDASSVSATTAFHIVIFFLLPRILLVLGQTRFAEIHKPKTRVIDQILPSSLLEQSPPFCLRNACKTFAIPIASCSRLPANIASARRTAPSACRIRSARRAGSKAPSFCEATRARRCLRTLYAPRPSPILPARSGWSAKHARTCRISTDSVIEEVWSNASCWSSAKARYRSILHRQENQQILLKLPKEGDHPVVNRFQTERK